MSLPLEHKTCLITGAANGFGAGIARRYHADGACVVLADINDEAGRALAETLGERAHYVHCDVTQATDVAHAVAEAESTFSGLDVVVNNAGTTHANRPLLEVDEQAFDTVIAVNIKSIFHMVHAAVPVMRRRGGGVMINIGSTAGIRPRPGLTWYNATKGAVNLLSKSLAVELGPDNIRVNAICPVMGETGLLERFMGMPDTPDNRARFVATVPLGRLSRPEDIAAAAAFLARDDAGFISGVEFPVDGARCV